MREMLGGFLAVTILAMVFASIYYTTGRPESELSAVSAMGEPVAAMAGAVDTGGEAADDDADDSDRDSNGNASAASVIRTLQSLPPIPGAVADTDLNASLRERIEMYPDSLQLPALDMTPSGESDDSSSGSTDDESSSSSDADASFADIQTTMVQSATTAPLQASPYVAERPFSSSTECKTCHPRQYQEWRTSPHSYSGISPTFYSLVAAGQNSFGAGALIDANDGVSQGGAVGNFCLPCHSPMGFIGLEGRFSGNNYGFADVQPQIPFVCNTASTTPFIECTFENSEDVCGAPGRCIQFQGRTCINMPPVTKGVHFPRVMRQCTDDSMCSGAGTGCPDGEDCGPCIIAPATIYYNAEAQEGINCESCHNLLPNHRRACQLFRNSDSVGVNSIDLQERSLNGRRLRLGPYPVDQITDGQGIAADQLPLVANAFHESSRVDSPLVIPYFQTDRPLAVSGVLLPDITPEILRPTAVTCEELPFCRTGTCEGGPKIGMPCGGGLDADFDCGGCSMSLGLCGEGGLREFQACQTSVDCATPATLSMTTDAVEMGVMDRGVADGTLGPLFAPMIGGSRQLDRPDGNYYRSSMFCGTCHDVRPVFGNPILRSCQEQDTHVCSTDDDCKGLSIGCSDDDCGPCVMESGSSPDIAGSPGGSSPTPGNVHNNRARNTGVRRVENLFSEWQISVYNHPELMFCENNSFQACTPATSAADCGDVNLCTVVSPVNNPATLGGSEAEVVVTCQDCHMSLFPRVPLVQNVDPTTGQGTRTPKNDLYSKNLAAIEGSQSDVTSTLPTRRVSTHYMAGVDLPLVKFSGQNTQRALRQELLDSAYKLEFEDALNVDTFTLGGTYEVELTITNVGVGHRLPAGFSHERQNWVQLFVQTQSSLAALSLSNDPFNENAPCNTQNTIATGADQADPSVFPNYPDLAGAVRLGNAGCVYRSGFILDKAHSETGEITADGSMDDEDPEDFFVVVGTRVRDEVGDPRIEVQPGAEGPALAIQYICEEEAAEAYLSGIIDGSGIGMGVPGFTAAHEVLFCDPNSSPALPGEDVPGFTAPGFGNPDCMVSGEDLGPCVPEIELSDANERGRCAKDLAQPLCQQDSDCANDSGPCLYACSEFPELECCDTTNPDPTAAADCQAFYEEIGRAICDGGSEDGNRCLNDGACAGGGGTCEGQECLIGFEDPIGGRMVCVGGFDAVGSPNDDGDSCTSGTCDGTCEDLEDVSFCIRGPNSGLPCTAANHLLDCDGDYECGEVGSCVIENRGIVNFQNQFRGTANGVCVDSNTPRDPTTNEPIPLANPLTGDPVTECLLNLSCALAGVSGGVGPTVCLVNGTCAEDSVGGSKAGSACTNITYRADCGLTSGGDTISCNVERDLELNGRPSESVFLQNHPFNFNSLAPLEPRVFKYDFVIPNAVGALDGFAGEDLVVSARVMNRNFPMRFLRNLIGTQVIRPPLIIEAQGDADDPEQCNDLRTIDIDCFVKPVAILGNAEPGGYVQPGAGVRTNVILAPVP